MKKDEESGEVYQDVGLMRYMWERMLPTEVGFIDGEGTEWLVADLLDMTADPDPHDRFYMA